MRTLCIQIQPMRASNLDLKRLRTLSKELARERSLVRRFRIIQGVDGIPFLNLMFATDDVRALWQRIRSLLYKDETIGAHLRQASMTVCEGEDGWDDYLLLHHFDAKVEIDKLKVRREP